MQVDIRAAQLLCSRLCHDLVGPVGAVNGGLELLAESAEGPFGADGAGGALDLVNRSADQVTRRLAFFRMAFGLGGGMGGGSSLGEGRDLASAFLADGKVALQWPIENAGPAIPASWTKMLLNLVLLGAECLPRGGALTVHVAELAEGLGVAMIAAGQGARFKDDVQAAMKVGARPDGLTARNVHGHFAACLAKSLQTEIEVHCDTPDEVRLAVLLPHLDSGVEQTT